MTGTHWLPIGSLTLIIVTVYDHNHINDITMVTINSSSYIVTMVQNHNHGYSYYTMVTITNNLPS